MKIERLHEILNEKHKDEPLFKSHLIIEAMKQAVNEVLDEAAEKADWTNTNCGGWMDANIEVNQESILNLKIE